jgi:membrane-bound ClpP family serine protease
MATGGRMARDEIALGVIGLCAATALAALLLATAQHGRVETESVHPPPQDLTPSAVFSIELFAGGSGVRLRGPIRHGATKQLETTLLEGGPIRFLELDSPGGLVAEARGLVRLIESFRLNTYVDRQCLSACTLAFASGRMRYLAPGARLGFHSYRLSSPTVAFFMDPQAEQQRDMELFRRRSVPQVFIERIDATPPGSMWFPSHRELLAARMVDVIGNPY